MLVQSTFKTSNKRLLERFSHLPRSKLPFSIVANQGCKSVHKLIRSNTHLMV